jgi:hypothetical protein
MEGYDIGANVYSEAKGEYTRQLSSYLVPAFHRFYMRLLEQAEQEEQNPKRIIYRFQELLSQTPDWNMDKVLRETTQISQESSCDYLEELLSAVFIAHTKILTAIRLQKKNKKLNITIPKLDHFIHRALCEASRLLWSSAYLFHKDFPSIERQKNHRQIEEIIQNGILQAIRGMLPVKSILKEYLNDSVDDEDDKVEKDDDSDDDEDEKEEKVEEKHETSEPEPVSVPVENATIIVSEPVSTAEPVVQEMEIPPVQESIELHETHEDKNITMTNSLKKMELTKDETITPPEIVQESPTILVATEPSVQFTDYDQEFGTNSSGYQEMSYRPKDDDYEDDEIRILDEDAGSITSFEDLDAGHPLEDEDFETL